MEMMTLAVTPGAVVEIKHDRASGTVCTGLRNESVPVVFISVANVTHHPRLCDLK